MKITAFVAVLFALSSAALAGPGLVLTAALEKKDVSFEEPIGISVTFENRGDTAVTYFEPLFAESIFFPKVRLVADSDGRVYEPWVSPFQSMAREGIQGALIKLGPGEKKVYRYSPAKFAPLKDGENSDWKENLSLPPGRYRVTAEYERQLDRVPFNTGGFDEEMRSVPGIFVGRLTSDVSPLLVSRQTKPRLVISVPDKDRAVVKLTLTNPLDTPYVLKGFPFLTVYSKMYGEGTAHPALTSPGDGSFDQPVVIEVPAGGTFDGEINLRALTFIRSRTPEAVLLGLGELVPEGTVHIDLDILDQNGGGVLGADGIYAGITAPESRGLESVAVVAEVTPAEVGTETPVTLAMTVRNDGEKPVGVAGWLRFPQVVMIRIEDATGKRPSGFSVTHSGGLSLTETFRPGEGLSRLAKGMTFDGDRFEKSLGLKATEVRQLSPGEEFKREIPLTSLLYQGFTPGDYRVIVGYRNYEPGLRFGWKGEELLGVGIVWSKPVSFKVR